MANRKKNKRLEQKIYGAGEHSWACESEVIVSIDNGIRRSYEQWEIKNFKQMCAHHTIYSM